MVLGGYFMAGFNLGLHLPPYSSNLSPEPKTRNGVLDLEIRFSANADNLILLSYMVFPGSRMAVSGEGHVTLPFATSLTT
jgi:hypothetical protein